MPLDVQVDEALRSDTPLESLRALARTRQAQGQDDEGLLQWLESSRDWLRQAGRERDEDLVLEVMDFVVGWCSPHVSLKSKEG